MPADLKKPFSESCCDGGAGSCDMSAQYCGCDMGAKPKPWYCERHRLEREMKERMETKQDEG
jgi:hypothetical protein